MDKKLLASRLQNTFKKERERLWTRYVDHMSRIYNVSEKDFKQSQKGTDLEQYDRNLVLINQKTTDGPMIQSTDFGYILGKVKNEVLQFAPTKYNQGIPENKFVKVANPEASQCIYQLILSKPEGQPFATTEDLETIYNSFYSESNPEPLGVPEFLSQTKNTRLFTSSDIEVFSKKSQSYPEEIFYPKSEGDFLSYQHAPSYFAFKKHVEKCVSKQLEEEANIRQHYNTLNINEEQKDTKTLLGLSWRYRARENFSWEPLAELFFSRGADEKSNSIMDAAKGLRKNAEQLYWIRLIEDELNKDEPDFNKVCEYLYSLKYLTKDSKDKNVFISLIISLAGVVSAPIAFLIGVLFVIPAYFYQAPYFGKPEFFYDVLAWFIESLLTALSCLIFPIAMYHSYQTTGSMNILKGECARIIDTLLEEMDKEKNEGYVSDVTPFHR